MRYSIMGFNQEKLAELQQQDSSFDMNDVLLLQYIKEALSRRNMTKIHDDNEQTYVWLAHSKIHEDLPFLNIKEDTLKRRIKKLVDLGLIESKVLANNHCRGTRAYYTTTELFDSLLYNQDNLVNNQVDSNPPENATKWNKIHLKEGAGGLKSTSNSQLILDSKLEEDSKNTILKYSTENPSIENSPPKRNIPVLIDDDVSDKTYDKPVRKTGERKKNLYEKCTDEINSFTDDEKLREALQNYLGIRLKIKDKPILGVGQWKGMLKTLRNLDGDKIAIVERAIERGWASFYALKDYQYTGRSDNKKRDVFAEDYGVKSVRPEDVEGGNLSGQIF